jgi:hypothetical protein
VRAVREVQLAGDLGGQPRLAHAARADQRDQASPADQPTQLGDRLGPPDQLVQPGRQAVAHPGGRRGRAQPGVLREDLPVQGDQLGAGVEAELVGEAFAQVRVHVQGLGLAPGRIQRPHLQGP